MSPRIARLLRESWLLLIAAGIVYLALILATFNRADPGWSQSGTVGRPLLNTGGPFGAWLSDLMLSLFGWSAWWWVALGLSLVWLGYRRMARPDEHPDHSLRVGAAGFALVLICSAAIESLQGLHKSSTSLPSVPGGIIGDIISRFTEGFLGFNGATLLLIALFAAGWSLFSGMSWLKVAERIGYAIEWSWRRLRDRRQERQDRMIGEQAAVERETFVAEVKQKREDDPLPPIHIERPVTTIQKSERVTREKQQPLFRELPDSPLPPLSLLEDPPPNQESVSAESLEFTSRLIERKLADFS